jgi:hypothetical protein
MAEPEALIAGANNDSCDSPEVSWGCYVKAAPTGRGSGFKVRERQP